MSRRVMLACALSVLAVLAGMAGAQKTPQKAEGEPAKPADVLVGRLRVHPKFHYRYYIDGFGDGQSCALFKADDTLKAIKPGTRIQVRGNVAARFFGNPKDPMAALVSTWIIYMDVDEVEIEKVQ